MRVPRAPVVTGAEPPGHQGTSERWRSLAGGEPHVPPDAISARSHPSFHTRGWTSPHVLPAVSAALEPAALWMAPPPVSCVSCQRGTAGIPHPGGRPWLGEALHHQLSAKPQASYQPKSPQTNRGYANLRKQIIILLVLRVEKAE